MSLETQLVELATQIGVDIATLQSALSTAQVNLEELQAQVGTGGSATPGLTMEQVTALLQADFGNPARDITSVYRTALLSRLGYE